MTWALALLTASLHLLNYCNSFVILLLFVIMVAIAQSSNSEIFGWHVVVERSGKYYLYRMRMPSQLPSSVVEERVLALYYREQPWWSYWLCTPATGIVTIVGVCQHFHLRVKKVSALW